MLEAKPDFGSAQARLMRTASALTRRLVHYETSQVPRTASTRLREYVGSEPPPAKSEPVAAALHSWVVATLALTDATAAADLATERVECPPAMTVACECVCDLFGLDGVKEDLKGALLLAKAFPLPKGGRRARKPRYGGRGA